MGFLLLLGVLFLIVAFSGGKGSTNNTYNADYDFDDMEDFEDTPSFSELVTGKKADDEHGLFGFTDGWDTEQAKRAYNRGEIDAADLQLLYDSGVISAEDADSIDCGAVEYEAEDLDRGENFDD